MTSKVFLYAAVFFLWRRFRNFLSNSVLASFLICQSLSCTVLCTHSKEAYCQFFHKVRFTLLDWFCFKSDNCQAVRSFNSFLLLKERWWDRRKRGKCDRWKTREWDATATWRPRPPPPHGFHPFHPPSSGGGGLRTWRRNTHLKPTRIDTHYVQL